MAWSMNTELPEWIIRGTDTRVAFKVHRLAHQRGLVAFASLVGSANAVKLLRDALAAREGIGGEIDGQTVYVPKDKNHADREYLFRQTGLQAGYIHAVLRRQEAGALLVIDDSTQEWTRELLRISTAPILPEFIPWLRKCIEDICPRANLTNMEGGCAEAYTCNDHTIGNMLVEGVEGGHLQIPECHRDLAELKDLPSYVQAYANEMMLSTSTCLRPLFDPKLDAVDLPPLKRKPFAPQGWMAEAIRRAVA